MRLIAINRLTALIINITIIIIKALVNLIQHSVVTNLLKLYYCSILAIWPESDALTLKQLNNEFVSHKHAA